MTIVLLMEATCSCPIHGLLSLLGKKRVIHILKQIRDGNNHFNEIKKSVGAINAKVLTQRLGELIDYDLITRDILSQQPRKIQYSLTNLGADLAEQLEHLSSRAKNNFMLKK